MKVNEGFYAILIGIAILAATIVLTPSLEMWKNGTRAFCFGSYSLITV